MKNNAWRFFQLFAVLQVCAVFAPRAGEGTFSPIKYDEDTSEEKTALWCRPNMGTADTILPLKTRVWATKESVTGGVAMKLSFEKGSTGKFAIEQENPFSKGLAGVTFYAKASKALKLNFCRKVTVDVGAEWKKYDFTWEQLGLDKNAPKFDWQIEFAVEGAITDKTWLIVDRFGVEGPEFNPTPKIEVQAGPDVAISSKEILYGAENLAKTAANLKAKKPFKIIALGDSVTAGAQMSRGSPNLRGPEGPKFLYFAHLARLLEESFGYKGITPVQHGHGGWSAGQGLGVVDKEVVAESGADDLVMLEFGANDIGGRGMAVEAWKADMKKLIARVKTKTDQIIIMSPTTGGAIPKNAEAITKAVKEIVAEDKVAAADITKLCMYRGEPFAWALLANQYHPDFMGHIIIGEMIAPMLTEKHVNYPE